MKKQSLLAQPVWLEHNFIDLLINSNEYAEICFVSSAAEWNHSS